jgi:hypothetical protein
LIVLVLEFRLINFRSIKGFLALRFINIKFGRNNWLSLDEPRVLIAILIKKILFFRLFEEPLYVSIWLIKAKVLLFLRERGWRLIIS